MENINLNHVVIFGYREKYYVNPNVTVYKNGMLIGMVAHLGRSQFEINEPCELAFNVRYQTITCKVNPGDQIQLSLNRWSGKLTAQLIENSNSHQELIEKNKQQDSVGESGKSTAQLIENSNSHQELIEKNKQQDSVGESGKSTAQLIENSNSHQELIEKNKQQDSVGESGKSTAQLIENSNSHQEIIERNKQQDRKGVKKLAIFIVLMGIIVGACWIPSILDSSSSSSSSSYTSQYKSFRTAVDDGSIYPGMTYEQIAKICGESRYVRYSRGRVQYVHYGNYQLCFDNYGRYEYYNYSTY